MKKTLILLIGFLSFIFVLLSLLSQGDGYHAERSLWRLDHQLEFIASHVESTPDFTMDRLADRYRQYIKKYAKTIYSKQAEMTLGDLFALRKNYPQARLEYQKAICPDKALSAQAEFTIAKSYEIEGHGDKALVIYKDVVQKYPLTSTGFLTPMYLAGHDGDYAYALAFYQKLAAQYPKTRVEYES